MEGKAGLCWQNLTTSTQICFNTDAVCLRVGRDQHEKSETDKKSTCLKRRIAEILTGKYESRRKGKGGCTIGGERTKTPGRNISTQSSIASFCSMRLETRMGQGGWSEVLLCGVKVDTEDPAEGSWKGMGTYSQLEITAVRLCIKQARDMSYSKVT